MAIDWKSAAEVGGCHETETDWFLGPDRVDPLRCRHCGHDVSRHWHDSGCDDCVCNDFGDPR